MGGVHGANLLAALLTDGGPAAPLPTGDGGLLTLIVGSVTSITIAAIGAAAVWRRRRRGDDLDEVSAFTKAVTVELNFARFRRRTNQRLRRLERDMGDVQHALGELQAARRPKGTRHAGTQGPD